MSAAHCAISTLLLARLGAYDITTPPDGYNTIDAYVTAVYVHELYDSKRITNDISIMKLDRTLPITSYIRPICIPLSDELRYKDYTGMFGWVVSLLFIGKEPSRCVGNCKENRNMSLKIIILI